MLHRTVWDTPSARSKKEVSFRLETGVKNVTSNCMVPVSYTHLTLPTNREV